jgi:hypothetical protein
MGRQLCHCCLNEPNGSATQQPYAIGMPGPEHRMVAVRLCFLCMISVCQAVNNRTAAQRSAISPVQEAIEDVRKAYHS